MKVDQQTKAEEQDPKSWIAIQSEASGKEGVKVGLDHQWLNKDGVYCSPDEPGAVMLGFTSAGLLKPGKTMLLAVSPGLHELMVHNDVYASEPISVVIPAGETQKLICGDNYRGIKKVFYGIFYLFHREIPGRFYYFLRELI